MFLLLRSPRAIVVRMANVRFTKVVGLRLSETLLHRMQRVAAEREQRMSEVCRDAIREHLARLERSGEVVDGDREHTN